MLTLLPAVDNPHKSQRAVLPGNVCDGDEDEGG